MQAVYGKFLTRRLPASSPAGPWGRLSACRSPRLLKMAGCSLWLCSRHQVGEASSAATISSKISQLPLAGFYKAPLSPQHPEQRAIGSTQSPKAAWGCSEAAGCSVPEGPRSSSLAGRILHVLVLGILNYFLYKVLCSDHFCKTPQLI